MRIIYLAVALLVAAPATLAGDPALEQLDAKLKECGQFGRAYLALAEYRNNRADKAVAINRTTEFLDELGQTGSHLPSKRHRKAVERFADYVYGHPEMRRETLFLYGSYDCAFSKLMDSDERYFTTQKKLESLLMSCQTRHATHEAKRKKLAPCVQDGAVKLVTGA